MKAFVIFSTILAVTYADTVSFSSFQIGSGPLIHTSLGGHHEPTLKHHAPSHHAPAHHAPVHHAPVHHAPAHHVSGHHAPAHHAPVHHAPVHHAPVHHAPVHHPTVHHAPVHHAPLHHVPAHHAPAHHAPVHHVPVHHAPVHHAPLHHVPAHHAPVHHAPAHHIPVPAVKKPLGDIVDVAVGAGSFKTLVKIVGDLGLVDTLKTAEALTVFAPTDEAFAKLPEGTLQSLTPDQAKEIVLRHVVAARVPAAAVVSGPVKTLGGEEITLVKSHHGVQVQYNGGASNVVTADVLASNGVIHVIDKVIL